jgi:hypothetical protein
MLRTAPDRGFKRRRLTSRLPRAAMDEVFNHGGQQSIGLNFCLSLSPMQSLGSEGCGNASG